MLLRLAKLEGLLEVARNSRVLSGPVSPEQAAIAVGDLSRHSAADVLRSGRLLEAAAYDADFDGDWERAYTLCLAAEVAYGPASANAPLMVVRAAEMLLKLGDYQTIDGLMRRLDTSYLSRRGPLGSVSDPFTWGSAELVRAQIALHHARYADALVHARRALDVVQYGEGRLDAWHALGRAYAGLARQCRPMAAQLIRNSKRAFRAAMEQHRAAGMESSLG